MPEPDSLDELLLLEELAEDLELWDGDSSADDSLDECGMLFDEVLLSLDELGKLAELDDSVYVNPLVFVSVVPSGLVTVTSAGPGAPPTVWAVM